MLIYFYLQHGTLYALPYLVRLKIDEKKLLTVCATCENIFPVMLADALWMRLCE